MSQTSMDTAEMLRAAHAALVADLCQLSDEASTMSAPALRSRLNGTKQDLIEHFQLEEENGYLDSLRKKEPCLELTLDKLANEHCGLLHSLDGILAQLEQPHPPLAEIQRQVRAWIREVRAHEFRENDLIQDAFGHDLGAGD